MKKFLLVLGIIFAGEFASAQTNNGIIFVTTAPSGSCAARANVRERTPNGTLYTCQSGTWAVVGGGASPAGSAITDAQCWASASTFGVCVSPTLTGTNFSGIPNSATTATSANTVSAIVARDGSGNFNAGSISLSGNISTGVGGSAAGYFQCGQGTAPSNGTTAIQIVCPASVTSYQIVMAAAAATGIPHFANSANTITQTISAINLATADVTGIVPSANGGTGINNGSSTLTIAANVVHSGAFVQTLTCAAACTPTFPSGTHSLAPLDSPSFTTPTLGAATFTTLSATGVASAAVGYTYTGNSASGIVGFVINNSNTGGSVGKFDNFVVGYDRNANFGASAGALLFNINNTNLIFGTNNTQRGQISAAGGFFLGAANTDPGIGVIQPSVGYKSTDGTSGATVTTCTGFKNGLCISGT